MDIRSKKSPQQHTVSGAGRYMLVTASSLAMAGLLGACASPGAPVAQTAPAQPKPVQSGSERLPIIGTLKNAETALSDYARARHREATLREALQSAADAAMVARHRQTIGAMDFLAAQDADKRLATARRNLQASEAGTREARDRLYRALGIGNGGEKVGSGAATVVPVSAPAETLPGQGSVAPLLSPQGDAQRFAPSRLL